MHTTRNPGAHIHKALSCLHAGQVFGAVVLSGVKKACGQGRAVENVLLSSLGRYPVCNAMQTAFSQGQDQGNIDFLGNTKLTFSATPPPEMP